MPLYNVKANSNGYHIHKFDEDLNPEADYDVTFKTCSCKAGHRVTCRHRQMLPVFTHLGRVNTGWFYDFENENWYFLDQEHGIVPESRVKGWWRRA